MENNYEIPSSITIGGSNDAFGLYSGLESVSEFKKYLVKNILLHSVSPDDDRDHLNAVAEDYYYYTDDDSEDCDDDGLTDIEEVIVDTNPADIFDPGIYIRYEDDYDTERYWCWRYGIATDSVVIRRGTTFNLYTTDTAEITITYLHDGRVWRDDDGGKEHINKFFSSSSVGQYEFEVKDGNREAKMNVYAIFKLPDTEEGEDRDKLTSAGREAFLYNEDEGNNKDTIAVWFQQQDVQDDNEYKTIDLRTFDTLQYTKSIFVDHVIEQINGESTVYGAAQKLQAFIEKYKPFAEEAGSVDSMEEWLDRDNKPTSSCGMFAAALTSMMRSAGIPARPIVRVKHSDINVYKQSIDHSTEMWLDIDPTMNIDIDNDGTPDDKGWYVCRGYYSPSPSIQKRGDWGGTNGKYPYEVDEEGNRISYYIATFNPLINEVNEVPLRVQLVLFYYPSEHTITNDYNLIIENTPYWGAETKPGVH